MFENDTAEELSTEEIALWEEEERSYWHQEYREPDDSALCDWYDEDREQDYYTGTDY
jgi:hypothetical protein